MPAYTLSPMFQPQYVSNVASKLTFATPTQPQQVPAQVNYQIVVLHVANVSANPVTLVINRVPSGGVADASNVVVPQVVIPVATQSNPFFDVSALWGAVLVPGDSIVAVAGAADSLVIQGDGMVITL
jgi:hypothetical protein